MMADLVTRTARVAPEKRIHHPPAAAFPVVILGEDRMSVSYRQKLLDPRWQRKRLEVLQLADFRCESCCSDENTLHVHHKFYVKGREPWEYEATDLVALCEDCHEFEHDSKRRIEQIIAAVPRMTMPWEDLIAIVGGFLMESIPNLSEAQATTINGFGRVSTGADDAFQIGCEASLNLYARREKRLSSKESAS